MGWAGVYWTLLVWKLAVPSVRVREEVDDWVDVILGLELDWIQVPGEWIGRGKEAA